MKKFKWFKLRMSTSFTQAIKKLRATTLHEERSFGFNCLPSDTKSRFSFRHLTRTSIRVTVIDQEGNAGDREIETLDAIDFDLFEQEGGIWMRVENPPRSLRDLLTHIELTLGWGFASTPVVLSIDQQRSALCEGDAIRMVAFKGLGSSPEHKAVARFEVASKEGIEPENLDFLSGLEFRVDHATFEVVKSMLRGQVSFAATGLVKVAGPLLPFLVGAIEKQVTKLG